MSENNRLLGNGFAMVARNKRYLIWFWLLNLTLGELGTGAFRRSAHAILDHSLASGRLVHGFDLATFIELRDRGCRTPYCDAPIRHRDHAKPWAEGGRTTADNGLGSCERCNYAKEAPGWRVSTRVDENGRHTAEFTTPTGKRYQSGAPPSGPTITISELEVRIGVAIARHAA